VEEAVEGERGVAADGRATAASKARAAAAEEVSRGTVALEVSVVDAVFPR
jgi:hypothetical protein